MVSCGEFLSTKEFPVTTRDQRQRSHPEPKRSSFSWAQRPEWGPWLSSREEGNGEIPEPSPAQGNCTSRRTLRSQREERYREDSWEGQENGLSQARGRQELEETKCLLTSISQNVFPGLVWIDREAR